MSAELAHDIRQSMDAIAAALECCGQLPDGHLKFIEETLERCLPLAEEREEAA